MVDIGIFESLFLRQPQHFIPFFLVQELSLLIQQFQSVPHFRIMRSGNDNASTCTFHRHGQFRCRGGCQTDVNHIESHAHQCSANHISYHFAWNTRITSHHNLIAFHRCRPANQHGIGRSEFYNIQRIQRITRCSANSAADTGNRFD